MRQAYGYIAQESPEKTQAARVMSFIKSLEIEENEPPLTADDEEGLRIANVELAQGKDVLLRKPLNPNSGCINAVKCNIIG